MYRRTHPTRILIRTFRSAWPFASATTGVPHFNLPLALEGSRDRNAKARINQTHSKRISVQPLAFAAESITGPSAKSPKELKFDPGSDDVYPLLIVDSLLSAKEITLTMDGDSSAEVRVQLEEEFAGIFARLDG